MTILELLRSAQYNATLRMAQPGDWLTGRQRLAVWAEVRDATDNPLDAARRAALSPEAVAGSHAGNTDLSATAVEVVHRITSDPGRLTRSWADAVIEILGEEAYTELVGVTSIVTVIDRFDQVMGHEQRDLPESVPGEPARIRPDGVGDVGAWVSQSVEKTRANVSRAITLVPQTQAAWRPLVDSHYSRGGDFLELIWNRALSRAQVELVAARTTALNECFY